MPYALNAGTKIYWEERGQGDPLLLIMGLGATLDLWHRVTPMVSAKYRTILLDNRGAGRSDAPPGPYSIPQMADDALAVLKAAGAAAARVFGASMGGMIAQELALHHPARVHSLILGCTAPGAKAAVPADREVGAALAARMTLPASQAIRAMVPFTYDASTPRARVDEDIAIERHGDERLDFFGRETEAGRLNFFTGGRKLRKHVDRHARDFDHAVEHHRRGNPKIETCDDSERQPHLLHRPARGVERRDPLVPRTLIVLHHTRILRLDLSSYPPCPPWWSVS